MRLRSASSGADDSVWLCRTIPSGKHFSESPLSGSDDGDDDGDGDCGGGGGDTVLFLTIHHLILR